MIICVILIRNEKLKAIDQTLLEQVLCIFFFQLQTLYHELSRGLTALTIMISTSVRIYRKSPKVLNLLIHILQNLISLFHLSTMLVNLLIKIMHNLKLSLHFIF